MNFAKKILLTGAGFTKNFGGPLASAVQNDICNHSAIKADPILRKLAEDNDDFEFVYNQVLTGNYTSAQQVAMRKVMSDVYEQIDNRLRSIRGARFDGINLLKVSDFLKCFEGQTGMTVGGFFTLNQDLFIERHHYNSPYLSMPSIGNTQYCFQPYNANGERSGFNCSLPDAQTVAALKQKQQICSLAYIKLHGSCSWSSAISPQQMVIGANKINQIIQEPLLNWYFDLFKESLNKGGQQLLCFGYGFRDEHVNQAIWEGIRDHDLQLFIMSPQSRSELRKAMLSQHCGQDLADNIEHFFDFSFADICPQQGHRTSRWGEMCKVFFGQGCLGFMGS
jgi:hypothetical protein